MPKPQTLPGVDPSPQPPRVVSDSRQVVRRAKRLALVRDAGQLLLLGVVDWMFIRWPLARVPGFDREASLILVAVVNAIVITSLVVTRLFPRWSARRIAATWGTREQQRFGERRASARRK